MNDEQLKEILAKHKVIASVGLSSTPGRASTHVCAYLKERGYTVIPVNPNEAEVIGEKSYPDLASVPAKVDIVQIFRKPEAAPAIVEEAIRIGAKVVWMQDGAGNPAAAERAREAGLAVVVDDCMMRVHARLFGR